MTRHTYLMAMLVTGMVLSLATGLQADTKIILSHSNHGAGFGVGIGIGRPIVYGGCYPPAPRPVIVGSPWRHRPIHGGPRYAEPIVMHPPVVRVMHPPVVRHVVVRPEPVIVSPCPPVEDITITVWVTNSNGSQTTVRLTRQGSWYVGPLGEYYAEMPTNEQLRVVYGF